MQTKSKDNLHIVEDRSTLEPLDPTKIPDTKEILYQFDPDLPADEEALEEEEEEEDPLSPQEEERVVNALSEDYIFCASSIYMQSWANEFDKQWLAQNAKKYKKIAQRNQDLNNARLKAYIALLYPAIQNYQYDLPVVIDSKVVQWITYFQTRGRRHFVGWLRRSQLYIPSMSEELEKHGLPKDLVYLAMIESGFNNRAKSFAGAVGPWQFMPRTAKQYGLKINMFIDERRDAVKSTKAAASYLTYLYTMFGNWHLAAASYNAGEGRILRAMKHHKEDSFFGLAAIGKALPLETQNYPPKLIAAMLISKNPEKFGFDVRSHENPLTSKTLTVHRSISLSALAKDLNVNKAVLEQLNPELRLGVTPPAYALTSQGYELKIPQSKYDIAQNIIPMLPDATIESQYTVAKAKRSESIKNFSKRNGFSLANLLQLNPHLTPASIIKQGEQLTIPVSEKVTAPTSRKLKTNAKNTSPKKATAQGRKISG